MDELAEQFESHREHLNRVAYRMLGSTGEAEDAVQEAWLRLSRSDGDAVANLGGWLTTVVARVCLDMLRTRRSRREELVGTWLPEPIVSADDETDPAHQAELADSVGIALLVVLAPRPPAVGAPAVARELLARAPRFAPLARPAIVNGAAGLYLGPTRRPAAVVGFTVAGGRIAAIDLIVDREKLREVLPD